MSILISIIASIIFAVIVFFWRRLFDCLKFRKNVGTYIRRYKNGSKELKDEIAAIAKIEHCCKRGMKITVTTLINATGSLLPDKHYKFSTDNIQKWQGEISMENKDMGKLHWYYIEPASLKKVNRSGFKRILFLHNFKVVKLFGEDGFGEEVFIKN